MSISSSPVVSVVMPTYNRAKLLPQIVASILDQDFKDFDLLIVDDGSADNTAEVVEKLQAQDSRVRYLRLPRNQGSWNARNVGLQNVSGEYIAMADSDDPWLTGKLSSQVDVMTRHPEIDILFGDFWNFDYVRKTEYGGFAVNQRTMQSLIIRPLENGLWLVENGFETAVLKSGGFIGIGTIILRSGVLDKVGLFDGRGQELEFFFRAAVLGAKYAYVDRSFMERYRYYESITGSIVHAQLVRLERLKECRQTCRRAKRSDLLRQIRAAENRTWTTLIVEYGKGGQRFKVIRAFLKSLRSGLSAHKMAFTIIALLGPQAITYMQKKRKVEEKSLQDLVA